MIQNISEIEKRYPDWFDPSSELSREDQKYIWENSPLTEDTNTRAKELNTNVNGNDNGGCKQRVNTEQTTSKQQIVEILRTSNYRTPPKRIAELLTMLFYKYSPKNDHWLWVAQHYNPRAINWVINEMINLHVSGRQKIINPAAYFTYLIKKRRKRREFTNNNCGCKQHTSGGLKNDK
ncbi:MAG: hypothetical protein ACOX6N_04945 [Patescibacteria group bacterium]|jgi:hypothetical protein